MNVDKSKICDLLAGTADPETVSAIKADLSERDRSKTVAWLTRLSDMAETLQRTAESGRLTRWLEEDDAIESDAGPDLEEGLAFRDEPLEMPVGTRGASPWTFSGGIGHWPITIPDDEMGRALARAIGERCYGNAEQVVSLTLHVIDMDDGSGRVLVELEASPPPLKEPLIIVVDFKTGDRRTFTVVVPVSPRASTRSSPCEPLPAEAARVDGGQWMNGGWPAVFKVS